MDGALSHSSSQLRNAAGHALRASCHRLVADVHERRCPSCKNWFPWTAEYFHRRGKQFLWNHCKACACEQARARHIPTVRHYVDRRDPAVGPARSFDAQLLASLLLQPLTGRRRDAYDVPAMPSSQMTFEQALTALKSGMKVARGTWRDSFIFLVPGSTFQPNRAPLLGIVREGATVQYHSHIDQRMSDGVIAPWNMSQVDILAKDWQVVSTRAALAIVPPALAPS